jgi:hypothetical protein
MANRVVVPARRAGNRFMGSLIGLQIRALAARYDNPNCRIGPPGYISLWNRFLGSLNVYKFGLWQRHDDSYCTSLCLFAMNNSSPRKGGRRGGGEEDCAHAKKLYKQLCVTRYKTYFSHL